MNEPGSSRDLFYVRIPSGQEFGPVDSSTILEWEAQGRVNESCQIRSDLSGLLLDFAVWKNQGLERTLKPAVNIFGDQIGRVNPPANQSVLAPKSRANTVLILGLCSWLLCLSFIGAPICAFLAIGFGISELGRMHRGEIDTDQRPVVWIGIVVASANLLFVVIFTLVGLIAAIAP